MRVIALAIAVMVLLTNELFSAIAVGDPPTPGESRDAQGVVMADPLARDTTSSNAPPEPTSATGPNASEKKENGAAESKENREKKGDGEDKKNGEGEEKKDAEKEPTRDWFNVFGQGTIITQGHGPFNAPYSGMNSLPPVAEMKTSETATLFLGMRPWRGTEVYFDPEIAGGEGFGNVTGIAGFPNGEIPRVEAATPTPYIARLYCLQTFGLGGDEETIESGPNQLPGKKDISRLTLAFGRLAASDWFDNNRYSHDPRSQFENWCVMYNGAWDYPADVRGYTWGGVLEFNQEQYAIRYGIFAEPKIANGPVLDQDFQQAYGQAWELELRHKLGNRPGKTRWMFYTNKADMGNYRDSLALSPIDPEIAATRTYASRKYGFCANFEQELTDDLGVFGRIGWNDGQTETWAFTEIDRTAAIGMSLKGTGWRRSQDVVGLALACNGLSAAHRDYLAAGGYGFIIGDGALNYQPEMIVESYYRWEVKKDAFWISPDFQFVNNPAYNHDRGPVTIWGLRAHFEF